MSDTYVKPGTTTEDRAQRLQQRSSKFQPRRQRGSRNDQKRQAVEDSRRAA